MFRFTVFLLLTLLLGCQSNQSWHVVVSPDMETEAVNQSGDAADDPAVWVNPIDAEKSLIIGTQKKQGLYTYNLNGRIQQFIPAGRLNNVDIRQNYMLRGGAVDVVAASNRSANTISLFHVTETGQVIPWDGVEIDATDLSEVYGFCMGLVQRQLIFVVTGKFGDAELYRLETAKLDNDRLKLRKLRTLDIPSQSEGCVIDDATGDIYIGEEAEGVWLFNHWAEEVRELIIEVDGEKLAADVEGLALIRHLGEKYLMVSSQGNNQFPIYKLSDYSHVAAIKVDSNDSFDKVTGTDGIDINQGLVTKQFPTGVFIAQDDKNTAPRGYQNFKVMSLNDILSILKQ